MSRIHEALKRAEQERAAGAPHDLPIEAVQAAETSPHVLAAELPEGAATPEAEPVTRPGSSKSLEEFLAKCPRRDWKLNSKSILFMNGNSHGPGTEEFRKLRSNLYLLRNKEEFRSILVTSAMPAEGKSFVTVNLAHAFARQHERNALIIDVDLRLPTLHKALGTAPCPGLTEYLRGEVDEAAIIQRGPSDNLYFIPAGASTTNPLELIGNGRFLQLMQKMAPLFDWVVLDSAPVLPVSDTGMIAEYCDGVLLVVRAKDTAFNLVQKAKKDLGEHRVLGVVLNGVEPRDSYGSYYYYSGTYGMYGAEHRSAKGAEGKDGH
jgi:capsular exopolysaccharide synthesis family protein